MTDHDDLDLDLRRYFRAAADPRPAHGALEKVIARSRMMRPLPAWRTGVEWPVSVRPFGSAAARSRQAWLVLALLVAAAAIAAVVVGALVEPSPSPITSVSNGWVAFSGSEGASADHDVYLVREGTPAHRIVGSDVDNLDEICPAFAPDGTRLAFGRAEGTEDEGYRGAALVIADIDAGGDASVSREIDVGGAFPPPCPVWSPAGTRVAFTVPRSERVPSPADGASVWVVTLDGLQIDVLPDQSVTDLDWSPDGTLLAIASSQEGVIADAERIPIRLYSVATGESRSLDGTSGAETLTWSPDGRRIADQRASWARSPWQELWVTDIDGSGQSRLAGGFGSGQTSSGPGRPFIAFHGIGPVWSPAGDRIVYQRVCAEHPGTGSVCREQHEVVVTALDGVEFVPPLTDRRGDTGLGWWFPTRVTWSPDGRELLVVAWWESTSPDPGVEGGGLLSIAVASTASPTVLHDNGIDGNVGDVLLTNQSWGRQPAP